MKLRIAIALVSAPLLVSAQGGPSVNENTGDLSYVYPFSLPPARGRHQPALGLVYSSASKSNRGYGFGWELTDSYIEKDVRVAPEVEGARTANVHVLVRGSQRDVLLPWGPTFVTEIRREPLSIQTDWNGLDRSWTVKDAQGTAAT